MGKWIIIAAIVGIPTIGLITMIVIDHLEDKN